MPTAEQSMDVAVSVRTRRIADLPGPKGVTLLGNMPQIDSMQFHRALENWASEFGPYYRIRLGRKQMLVLSDNTARR